MRLLHQAVIRREALDALHNVEDSVPLLVTNAKPAKYQTTCLSLTPSLSCICVQNFGSLAACHDLACR